VATAHGEAHGVSGFDALFLQGITGAAIGPLMYLGAKHMVTGYDHLAFLVGVIFFLYRLKDVALYVSLFTIGHSVTLLAGVLGHIEANPFIVDAIIGLSVVYKALDNMGVFPTVFGVQPDARVAVLGFGFVHGFGLATKLQAFALPANGLVKHRQLQRWCGVGATRGARRRVCTADRVACQARLSTSRLCDQHDADGGGPAADGIPDDRIRAGSVE